MFSEKCPIYPPNATPPSARSGPWLKCDRGPGNVLTQSISTVCAVVDYDDDDEDSVVDRPQTSIIVVHNGAGDGVNWRLAPSSIQTRTGLLCVCASGNIDKQKTYSRVGYYGLRLYDDGAGT